MKKFEYKIVYKFITEARLRQLGKQGWSLQTIVQTPAGYHNHFFMRELNQPRNRK